jgi:hypothetical protein
VGAWLAGPGAYIGIGGPVFLNLGVDFFGKFPVGKCNRAYHYEGAGGTADFEGFCSFGWSPRIGIVVAFGTGRSSQRRTRPAPPPSNPLPDVEPLPPRAPIVEPAEVPVPEPETVPNPDAADPTVPPPTDEPVDALPAEPSEPPPPTEGPTPPVAVPP